MSVVGDVVYSYEQVSGLSPLVGSLALSASECNLDTFIRCVDDSFDDNTVDIGR